MVQWQCDTIVDMAEYVIGKVIQLGTFTVLDHTFSSHDVVDAVATLCDLKVKHGYSLVQSEVYRDLETSEATF